MRILYRLLHGDGGKRIEKARLSNMPACVRRRLCDLQTQTAVLHRMEMLVARWIDRWR
jgi:hypothetical protein